MLFRRSSYYLSRLLDEKEIVILIGPRRVGKTTLALAAGEERDALYIDLESLRDRAKVDDPELYFSRRRDRLVIVDEFHRLPGLLSILPRLLERTGGVQRPKGRFLLIGSAAIERPASSDSAGDERLGVLEMSCLSVLETKGTLEEETSLWVRGGMPESFLAANDRRSMRCREELIQAYLEREIPLAAPRLSAQTSWRLLTMLAHLQGTALNVARLARNLGVDAKTAAAYVTLFADRLLVRMLPPWDGAAGAKRIAKRPRVYLRDSGFLHALLRIDDEESLLSHPIVGASWEGFVVENVLSAGPPGSRGYYYRAAGGAEIDLLVVLPDGKRYAIEVQRRLQPVPTRAFVSACNDVEPTDAFIVYPGRETYRLAERVTAASLADVAEALSEGGA